ncbi:hypothetical protein CcaverHIS002_0408550 [Cutaneotrichosporon cavernicola]|nr:hypothetical protein CcaverHIS002_0408550 [Cutaneotrichosporon cavernicola]
MLAFPARQAIAARQLHTTFIRSVRRPQKPFEAYIPRDPSSKPQAAGFDKRRAAQQDQLYVLAQEGKASAAEKYSDAFGLRTPGSEYKAESDAERFGHNKPLSKPRITAEDNHLSGLRRKAMQQSDVKHVLKKWRSGVDLHSGRFAVRTKELEALAVKQEKRAGRRAQREELKAEFRVAKQERSHVKIKLQSEQQRFAREMRESGFSKYRSKWLAKARWDPVQQRPLLLANDLKYIGGRDGRDLPALREAVWATEKAVGRTTGPDPTDTELGQPAEVAGKGMEAENRRWTPTKRLTYAAMSGMRELHAQDPATWTAQALGPKFGISYEAAKRILRSTWSATTNKDMGKWSRATDGVNSPVPQIRAVYALKRADEAANEIKRADEAANELKRADEAANDDKATGKETERGVKPKPKPMPKDKETRAKGKSKDREMRSTGSGTGHGGKAKVGNRKEPPPLRQRGGFGIKEA